jgi:hypothetical protein
VKITGTRVQLCHFPLPGLGVELDDERIAAHGEEL